MTAWAFMRTAPSAAAAPDGAGFPAGLGGGAMKIDLSCPVELWHFKLPTEKYLVVSLNLFNLA